MEFIKPIDASKLISFDEFVAEAYVVRVHADKSKERKLKCPKGYKAENGKCVPMTSSEKQNVKIGHRKAAKTFKQSGPSSAKRKLIRRRKALKARRDIYHLGS